MPNPPGANLDSTGTFTSANGFYAGGSNQFTLSYHDFVFTDAYTSACTGSTRTARLRVRGRTSPTGARSR